MDDKTTHRDREKESEEVFERDMWTITNTHRGMIEMDYHNTHTQSALET